MNEKINRHILCIDLKSFFASVECVERNLNPFSTPLVVANKKQGIPSRTRLYTIPKNIKYQIVEPRMKLYIQKSQEIVNIYLDFVSEEDLYIYSIDECFLDVTDYLKYYQLTDIKLAELILKTIEEKTKLTATCGIGPNMLLAKIAMDKEAKKYKNGIAKWTYEDIPTKLWPITPLSEVWQIGPRLQKKLNNLGIYTIYDLAHSNINYLKEKFGIIGKQLYKNANGIDNTLIKDLKKQPKEHSISHSQVLLKDYYNEEVYLIMNEMLEHLTRRLRYENIECNTVNLTINYSKTINDFFSHSIKLESPTQKEETIFKICKLLFDQYYTPNLPVRKISISLSKLQKKQGIQLNLFQNYEQQKKEEQYFQTIDKVQEKYGKNSILKATSLLDTSTIKNRNQTIGGHHE